MVEAAARPKRPKKIMIFGFTFILLSYVYPLGSISKQLLGGIQ